MQCSFVLDISLDSLAVYDDRDPTAAPSAIREKSAQLLNGHLEHIGDNRLAGLRIGVPQVRLLRCACLARDLTDDSRSTSQPSCSRALSPPSSAYCNSFEIAVPPWYLCLYRRPDMPSAHTMLSLALKLAVTWRDTMGCSMVCTLARDPMATC